jgi:hypothetical protein
MPASISLLPPVQPRSGIRTYRQNRYRRLQGGQFREWCRAVNMAPVWNTRFYLLCLLHLRRRRLKRREREFWEHPIVAARTLEGAHYTLYGRLREVDRKFFNFYPITWLHYITHETPITKTNKRTNTYLLQRRYNTTSDPMEDECATALRTNPAYLSRGRRHHVDMSVIILIAMSCLPLYCLAINITRKISTTDTAAGADTDFFRYVYARPSAPRFPRNSAHEGGEVSSLTHQPPLPSWNFPGTHFRQGLSRPQGHGTVGRNMSTDTVTAPGIDPGIIRPVAQRLNHYATPGPYMN